MKFLIPQVLFPKLLLRIGEIDNAKSTPDITKKDTKKILAFRQLTLGKGESRITKSLI